ncbi:MAG: hypothetical protein ACJAUH_003124 [Saprospiraceae bacterium]
MTIESYKQEITNLENEDDKKIFTQKHYFHGIPIVFDGREEDYYHFKKRIADNFNIQFYEVMIVGSSKFGFSPFKLTEFTLDSDIDVVIFNEKLFDYYFDLISDYQYKIKGQIIRLNTQQYKDYMRFIKYFIRGWMRPDLLPQNTTVFKEIKQNWDDFFKGISHSKSEVGNYIVKAGLFKSQKFAEKYYRSSIEDISNKLKNI